ncbi:MAG: glycosyltransferase family 2 protein [Gallintestinimicrobium sp.]
MKTTVVIPNYNGKHFLQDCLDSLLQSTVEIAVIVVDNGSTDGSVSWIQEHFPQVKLICFSENKGFCAAVNTGIEAAATPYVFLLNNDTKTDRFCLERLERAMEADEKIFSVGAKMLSMKEPELVDTAGDLYSAFGWAYAIGKGRPSSNYTAPKRVFSNCAGAALYRKAHLEQIGGFDELHLHTWKMWISDTGRRFSG